MFDIINSVAQKNEFLGTIQKELKRHNGRILSLSFLPNGDLVSGGEDYTIKIWQCISIINAR